jgi:hypothetical protein
VNNNFTNDIDAACRPVMRRPVTIVILSVALMFGLGVGIYVVADTVLPAMAVQRDAEARSNGQLQSSGYLWFENGGTFTFFLAPGVSEAAGSYLTCNAVRPALGARFEGAHFVIYHRDTGEVASDETPCP